MSVNKEEKSLQQLLKKDTIYFLGFLAAVQESQISYLC